MNSQRFAGWPLVGWCAAALVAMTLILLAVYGAGEVGIRVVIRATARTSFALFTGAFVASALQRTWPGWMSRWLLRNRRYLGVSFAVSHLIHLLAIIALTRAATDFSINAVTLVGGGLAYVFLAAMTATSFDRTAAWLGPWAWRRLHITGMYYNWFIFAQSYAPRAAQSLAYVPVALICFGAIGLRVYAHRASRRSVGI